MNGGISDTTTTSTGQTNDPAALLSTLLASAPGGGASLSASALGESPKTGGIRIGDRIYYDDGTSVPYTDPSVGGTPPPPPPPGEPPVVPPVVPPVNPPIRPPRPRIPAGEGSVNEEARKRGEMLSSFLASFQAAYQRNNPNFNFARNPKIAKSLGLPWSGDLGR